MKLRHYVALKGPAGLLYPLSVVIQYRADMQCRALFAVVIQLFCVFSTASAEENETAIEIRGAKSWPDYEEQFRFSSADAAPARDLGELLLTVPGVSGGRIGGLGIDPVIRGQSQNQLNVTADGAFTFSACPNRMDPPTSMITPDPRALVTVERGYSSVIHGPGGPGGRIAVDHAVPQSGSASPLALDIQSGYGSNGELGQIAAGGAFRHSLGYLRLGADYSDADDYEDGHGTPVRSAFTSYGGGIDAAFTGDDQSLLQVGLERRRTLDALFAGAGMDVPSADDMVLRLRLRTPLRRPEETLELGVFESRVDHLMDNYSLRERSAGFMRAPSESDTLGGRLLYRARSGAHELALGTDLVENYRSARRFFNARSRSDVSTLQSVLWPDITVRDVGLFVEDRIGIDGQSLLTFGIRYDNVFADSTAAADRAAPSMPMPSAAGMSAMPQGLSPNDLYQRYYGSDERSAREQNWGGVLRVERALGGAFTAFGAASRVARTADATERGIAGDMGSESWVGNPGLLPEKHHQFELGVSYKEEDLQAQLRAYHNLVDDFILRDRARGQPGILRADGATIYRNIDARLAGVELSAGAVPAPRVNLEAQIFATWGEDLESDRPLPQIPPIQGSIRLSYKEEWWKGWLLLRAAARQGRVDDDPLTGTGRDLRRTPGYAVIDLGLGAEIAENLELRAGVSNLFDLTYANHLNRGSTFDPQEVQVNEPGQSIFLQLVFRPEE